MTELEWKGEDTVEGRKEGGYRMGERERKTKGQQYPQEKANEEGSIRKLRTASREREPPRG